MRLAYKIFAWMLLFVFVDSFIYNWNKSVNYSIFSEQINQALFGLSYIVPLNVFGFIMRSQAKFIWEKIVTNVFTWFTITAFVDEIFFDPFTQNIKEHVVGLFILIIVYYYERFKKVRD